MWFIESPTYKEWKTTGSLMWIYGKRTCSLPPRSFSTIDGFYHYSGIREDCPLVCTSATGLIQVKVYLLTDYSSSSIIEDIQRKLEAGLAILTYFFVDFKEPLSRISATCYLPPHPARCSI